MELNSVAENMNETVSEYVDSLSRDTKSKADSGEPQFETLTRFRKLNHQIGWSEQIMTKGIPVPQINCEIAVPLRNFEAATQALWEWDRKHPGRLHYPFIYRVTGQSKAWLSPSHRGPVCWIGFLVYISQAGVARQDGLDTMRELQQLLAGFDGLPHWGKCFSPSLFDFNAHIARWKDFKILLARYDPHKKFLSGFCENLFFGIPKAKL